MTQSVKRVLILGFSVTEQYPDGYAQRLAADLKRSSDPVEVSIHGVGGIGVDALAYEFENFLMGARYDVVLLDLTSTAYRMVRSKPEEFAWPVIAVLAKAQKLAARVAMIHFWRSDVDFRQDMFIDVCDRLAGLMDIPSLNVARLVAALPETERAAMFKDEVHTTPAGAEFYFRQAAPLLAELLARPAPERRPDIAAAADDTFSLRISDLVGLADPPLYRRSGLAIPYVELPENQSLSLDVGGAMVFGGLSALIGPRTGRLGLRAGEQPEVEVTSYDAFAYYQRLYTHMLPEMTDSILSIRQLPGVPEIALRKGDKDLGPRVGAVFSLLGSKLPRAELMARARRLLDG